MKKNAHYSPELFPNFPVYAAKIAKPFQKIKEPFMKVPDPSFFKRRKRRKNFSSQNKPLYICNLQLQ
jgi:hypothetical protein